MKVTELLKGKKAWEKENLLSDKQLSSDIVDKLATDGAKKVREKAVYHKNISQDGLWKIVTQKKNTENEFILRNAFSKLSPELKLKWLKEKKFKIFKTPIFISIGFSLYEKTSDFPEFIEELSELILNNELNNSISRQWILRKYDVKKNQPLLELFKTKYSKELIKFYSENGLTKKETSEQFTKYIEETSDFLLHPNNDLGGKFVENMSGKDLTILIKKMIRISKEDLHSFSRNPNFKSKHSLILIKKDHTHNDYTRELIEKLPLDVKCEKQLFRMFDADTRDWRILNSWAKNPSHSRYLFDVLIDWPQGEGWSSEVVSNMLTAGNYSESDVETLMNSRSEYENISSYATLVKNQKFPPNKLRQLWQDYWHGLWDKKKIEGPSLGGTFKLFNMSFDDAKDHELVYNLLTKSALKSEFGLEYYNVIGDEKYLPAEAKDIFMF